MINVNNISKTEGSQVTNLISDRSNSNNQNLDTSENPWNITFYEEMDNNEMQAYNTFVVNAVSPTNSNFTLVVISNDGSEYYEKSLEDISIGWGDVSSHVLDSETVYIRTSDGVLIWNFIEDKTEQINLDFDTRELRNNATSTTTTPNIHHEMIYNPKTDTFLTLERYNIEIESTTYQYDAILEFDRFGNIIDFIDTIDWIPVEYWNGYERIFQVADITHTNSLFWDSEENVIYVNMRNLNTFYKINKTNGEVIWGLGQFGEFTLLDRSGNVVPNIFYHAHAVEKVENDSFILFNNNYLNTSSIIGAEPKSSMIEITIDEEDMVAQVTWKWTAPREYYSNVAGDADRLPNGHRLGTFGTQDHPNTDIGARIVEVDQTGKMIWEMNFPKNGDVRYWIYRTERFYRSPFIKPEFELSNPIKTVVNGTINLSFDYFNNFRASHVPTGQVEVFINGNLNQSSQINYSQFWQGKTYNYTFFAEEAGDQLIEFVFISETGEMTLIEVAVKVYPVLYVELYGRVEIEFGENLSLYWFGQANQIVNYSISLGSEVLMEDEWNGNSTIDVTNTDISVGSHELGLVMILSNGTVILDEMTSITVHPQTSPNIELVDSTLQNGTDISFIWGSPPTFTWNITDISPKWFEIRIEGVIVHEETLDTSPYLSIWTFPSKNEGNYQLIAKAKDNIGLESQFIINVTVLPPDTPLFESVPTRHFYYWQDNNYQLIWRVHGGSTYKIWSNDTILIPERQLVNGTISLDVENFIPGLYQLRVDVYNDDRRRSSHGLNLTIKFEWGDAYADRIIQERSLEYSEGENILGRPDGEVAFIYFTYTAGAITVDMGDNEEIIDSNGPDLRVIGTRGEYMVYGSNELYGEYEFLGESSEVGYFDISDSNITEIRYLRISYSGNGTSVEIDAIEAINYNSPEPDIESPELHGPDDKIFGNQEREKHQLTWNASDRYPWSYEIYINNDLTVSKRWNGSSIELNIKLNGSILPTEYVIEIIVQDLFRQISTDVVHIQIRGNAVFTVLTTTIYIMIILVTIQWKRVKPYLSNLNKLKKNE